MLICAISIYIEDRGPIFYTQDRTGKDGVIFKLTKLRTMIINAERNGPQWSREMILELQKQDLFLEN